MKYKFLFGCVVILIGLVVFRMTEVNRQDRFAYSTEKFNRCIEDGKIVFISFIANWDGGAQGTNYQMLKDDQWNQFFNRETISYMVYDRTDGIAHEELYDLKGGGGNGLLAVYSRKLGKHPLITHFRHLEVGHLVEIAEYVESGSDELILTTTRYETNLPHPRDLKRRIVFTRGIPKGAEAPEVNP